MFVHRGIAATVGLLIADQDIKHICAARAQHAVYGKNDIMVIPIRQGFTMRLPNLKHVSTVGPNVHWSGVPGDSTQESSKLSPLSGLLIAR